LLFPPTTHAQRNGGGDRPHSDAKKTGGDSGASFQPATPDPYASQLFCPVTGKKLGLSQPAVPVQTSIGERQPTFLGKLFGQKPTPGTVIYVCCPECIEKVRSNPEFYLSEIIADKACFSFTYATAPPQRPARVRSAPDSAAGLEPEASKQAKPPQPPSSNSGNGPDR
jgi:hypothetical protein